MREFQMLVVGPITRDTGIFSAWHPYHMTYQFVDCYPNDGFSAWKTSVAAEGEQIDVADTCNTYSGGYAQHALNRLYSQALLRLYPKLVVIHGLTGCTVDLIRVADLLDIPVLLMLDKPIEPLGALSEATLTWLRSSLAACTFILSSEDQITKSWPDEWLADKVESVIEIERIVREIFAESTTPSLYDYSLYEFSQRDHPLLVRMQRGNTQHFLGCKTVLDLACGVGIFLDCLRQEGIDAKGVERDVRIARYAWGMGLDVTVADALEFLDQTQECFDGIYCSHFVEHLPFGAVQRMLQLISNRMINGGILVLVFPDPESIRSQLLGFWRDPEHVRFYHPELITMMAATAGLQLEWSSYIEQPHSLVSFTTNPTPCGQVGAPPMLPKADNETASGIGEKLLQLLGLVTQKRFRRLENSLFDWSNELTAYFRQCAQVDQQLKNRTDTLWSVNQTWSWNDNVTLRLRKQSRD